MTVPTCEQLDNARRLADGLDKVAAEWPEHFNMADWVIGGGGGPGRWERERRHKQGEHPANCGTTGCALGWAPYLLGVPLAAEESWSAYGTRLLGVPAGEFSHLFSSMALPGRGTDGARAAAARLREYVARYEADCVEAGEVA